MSADNTPREAQEDSADNADIADGFFLTARVLEKSPSPTAKLGADVQTSAE